MAFTFTVLGDPIPKGSFRAYTYRRSAEKGGGFGARATNDNPRTTSWQSRIAFEAVREMRRLRLEIRFAGPVDVTAEFYQPRPKKLAKTVEPAHLKKPDVDKLLRATLDALKGVLFEDDSQVVRISGWKRYAGINESPRAVITVTPIVAAAPLFEGK